MKQYNNFMKNTFDLKIIKKDAKTKARAGEIHTAHGKIQTPCFVAVGTQATVKTLSPEELKEIGVQLLFGNTYHLHLRPGEETVKDFGGLSKFMSWNGPTITDSGGFQVFSLGKLHGTKQNHTQNNTEGFSVVPRGVPSSSVAEVEEKEEEDIEPRLVKITDDSVKFRSHIDGSLHVFTPEISIEIQKKLGADLILCFDECAPHPSTHEYTKEAMDRTHEWALRSLKAAQGKQYHPWQQALYGIIQGGIYKDLREESAKFISDLDFDGIAIGGVSVGESKKEMRDVLKWVHPYLPDEKPRHLLGIGEVDDIFDAVFYGMDTFDCVIPTRFGRYGIVFAYPPVGNVKNRFRYDLTKIINATSKDQVVDKCICYVCQNYTRGYLHHLFKANELLAYRLASYHNMHFLVNLTKDIRNSILEGNFEELKKQWLEE